MRLVVVAACLVLTCAEESCVADDVEGQLVARHPGTAGEVAVGDKLQSLRKYDAALRYHRRVHAREGTVLSLVSVATDLKGLGRYAEALGLLRQLPKEVRGLPELAAFHASLLDCSGDHEGAYRIMQRLPNKDLHTKLTTLDYLNRIAGGHRDLETLKREIVTTHSLSPDQLVPNYIKGLTAAPYHTWETEYPYMEPAVRIMEKYASELAAEFKTLESKRVLEPDGECLSPLWSRYEISPGWRQIHSCSESEAVAACTMLQEIAALGVVTIIRGGYSSIGAGAHIAPHYGWTNGQLKFHLGLQVPGACAGIQVHDKLLHWVQGSVIMIDDSFLHEAWNNCTSTRTIFQVVIQHPDI